jgi:hypothetical protein
MDRICVDLLLDIFGRIHGGVRNLQERVFGGAVLGVEGDADAGGSLQTDAG